MRKIIHVVGARPNFMKAAPVIHALQTYDRLTQVLVHTGQHYDPNMSQIFFDQLGIPRPDYNLEVGSGTHAQQTAEVMTKFEKVALAEKPDMLLVYGDVNSTVATAIVASKMGIPVAHVEAGLRSWDRSMPEEINRVLTDQISDLFFTPSEDGDTNLIREGIDPRKIHMVGNVMIDTLVRLLEQAKKPEIGGLASRFLLVTLHRPSNVDDPEMLRRLAEAFAEISADIQVVFPIHPRTRKRSADLSIHWSGGNAGLLLTEPLGYLEFLWLQQHATVVVTDSGGIQEETTFLRVPCLTLRENTERPVTVTIGSNLLIGRDTDRLVREVKSLLEGNRRFGQIPHLWDGRAAQRIASIIDSIAPSRPGSGWAPDDRTFPPHRSPGSPALVRV